MEQPHGEEDFSEDSQSAYEKAVSDTATPDHLLTLTAMMKIGDDMKSIFSSDITKLKADILSMFEKLEGAEKAGSRRDRAITRLEKVTNSKAPYTR